MTRVPQIATAIKSLLKDAAWRLGRETQFVKQASKLDSAVFAQSCVWKWSEHPDASLTQLSQTAASVGVAITPQGLGQRFDQEAASFLRQLLEDASQRVLGAHPAVLPVLTRFSAV